MKTNTYPLVLAWIACLAGLWSCNDSQNNITSQPVDTLAPTIIAVDPAKGETNVFVSRIITVQFSEAMDQTDVQQAFSITPAISGSFSWHGNVLNFKPDTNLTRETTYSLVIGKNARDLAGNPMAEDHQWTFTSTTFIPGCPSALKATVLENTVYLTWKDKSDNEEGFILESGEDTPRQELDRLAPNTTQCKIEKLDPNTLYQFYISAYNAYGRSIRISARLFTDSVIDTLYAKKDATLKNTHYLDANSGFESWKYENEQEYNKIGTRGRAEGSFLWEWYYHTLIDFGYIPSLVSCNKKQITSAVIELYIESTPKLGDYFDFKVGEISTWYWEETSVTETNLKWYYDPITNIRPLITGHFCRINVKKQMEQILQATRNHGGIVLRYPGKCASDNYYAFSNRTNTDMNKRPKLIIEF